MGKNEKEEKGDKEEKGKGKGKKGEKDVGYLTRWAKGPANFLSTHFSSFPSLQF